MQFIHNHAFTFLLLLWKFLVTFLFRVWKIVALIVRIIKKLFIPLTIWLILEKLTKKLWENFEGKKKGSPN
jgi:hypothetical protein